MDWNVVAKFLNDEERLRAARFIRSEDRLRFALTRTMLRLLLSKQLDVSIEKLKFEIGPYGKLMLPKYPMISFNVTHSGKHGLIIISDNRYLVGVDIEIIHKLFFWKKLISVVCTDFERKKIGSYPRHLQSKLFFKCWTAKEALLKAIGIGMTRKVLRNISVNPLISAGEFIYSAESYIREGIIFLKFYWLTDIRGCIGCIAFSSL
ncbi:MAG: 4'-phosphopantetheinyl transferase superfamily protein [Burkholderia sp.]|nr:4'-phosphopantetheinyl transferase superfamily protein [Burkholderia sp.]